jgi:hypothetical protein
LVAASELTEAMERPTLRAESVLDGIFSRAVVVVEADGDRLVYQSVWETMQREFGIDLHFATVGGTGGIADTCGLYRSLRIPIAVIADLDMLLDADKMSRVLTRLVDNSEERNTLVVECSAVAERIRRVPPQIEPSRVANRLQELGKSQMDWANGDDRQLFKELRKLCADLDRNHRLKAGGASAFEGGAATALSEVLARLRSHGLFLVPVGELEQWLRDYEVGVSRSEKRAWSSAAAQRVHTLGRRSDDVWAFIHSVATLLTERPPSSAS